MMKVHMMRGRLIREMGRVKVAVDEILKIIKDYTYDRPIKKSG